MQRLLLSILILTIHFSLYAQADQRLKGLEADLQAILKATQAPGFAVAIVEKDKVLYAKGFGYQDYENKVPVDENTLFAIGSCTKAFTSTILGQLREEGHLSFDDSPLDYIPGFKFNNDEMNNQIIIKDMMCHRTGLPRHDLSWYLFPNKDKAALLKRVAHQEPFAAVRDKWYYNNFMFLAQGVITEELTSKSWEDNISERFFKPLKMNRSNATIQEMKESSNAAFGYELTKEDVIQKMDYYDISGMSPAGSINSSVLEMANWVIAWINDGKFNGEEVVPATYRTEAMSSQMVISAGLPSKELPDLYFSNYGYGWFMSSYKGHYRVEHGGNIDGFSANTAFYPTDSIGVIVLANQNGSAVPSLVRNTVADYLLSLEKTDWAARYAKQIEESKKAAETNNSADDGSVANTKPSHILQDYTGKYSHPGYGEFEIVNSNDSLFAVFSMLKFYLKHFHYDIFQLYPYEDGSFDEDELTQFKVNFQTNDVGDISGGTFQVEPTIEAITFKRTPSEVDVDKSALEKYVGAYSLGPQTAKVSIKNDKTLYILVQGQPEYEMVPTGKHKFSFKTLDGFKVEFVEATDGAIKALKFIQPNGTFTAVKQ